MQPLIDSLSGFVPAALKKETEAEGASHEELFFFRSLAARMGVDFHVKIGGAEALSDARLCQHLGANAIIAPMIESPFALQKFVGMIDKLYEGMEKPKLIITLESQTAVQQLEAILAYAKGRIHEVTIGRTDLSASYNDSNLTPEAPRLMDIVQRVAERVSASGLKVNLGGSISLHTPTQLAEYPKLLPKFQHIETRNVVFAAAKLEADTVKAALTFEQAWLHQAGAQSARDAATYRKRLETLAGRLNDA